MSNLEEMKEQIEKVEKYPCCPIMGKVLAENAIWTLQQRIREAEAQEPELKRYNKVIDHLLEKRKAPSERSDK